MEKDIRIAMIGAGGIARDRHLPGLAKLEGIELVAVANRSRASGEMAAAAYGFQKVYEKWQDAVDDPEVNVVFICTPPYKHREMSTYALERGKHVFCQARMALDLQDALAMREVDRSSTKTTMLCPPPHYMAIEHKLHELIENGTLGELRHVALLHCNNMFLDSQAPLHWRQRQDLQGINMLDVGMMAEVLQRWFGPIVKLSADSRTWVSERPADRDGRTEVELPDSVDLIASFEKGMTLTGLFTGAVAGGEPHMIIYGSKGSVKCYPTGARIELSTAKGTQTIEVPEAEQGGWTVEGDFVEAVREGRKGKPSFEDGVAYMRVAQAVIDSIRSGGAPQQLDHD